MSQETFDICWNEHQLVLSGLIADLQNTPDVTLVCEGAQVPGNRFILSACSPYMYSLLKTSSPAIVIMPGVEPELLASLITFVLSGSILVNQDDLNDLVKLAENLQFYCFSALQKEVFESPHKGEEVAPSMDYIIPHVLLGDIDGPADNLDDDLEKKEFTPRDMKVIDENEYLVMKNDIVDSNLRLESEGKVSSWKCVLCDRKWEGNNRDTRCF